MFEGYRKRSMLLGGGLLYESPGWVNRTLQESFAGWTETVLLLRILRGALNPHAAAIPRGVRALDAGPRAGAAHARRQEPA